MASLYGDLPPPGAKSKENEQSSTSKSSNTNSSQGQSKISKLYNFSPSVKSTLKSIKKPVIPASWTTATQFKPTQKKHIIKTKTTIKSSTTPTTIKPIHNDNNENIPVPTIISSKIIAKKKDTIIDNSIIEEKQNNWLKSNVTSKKRKQNNLQNNKKSVNIDDIYDPKYPNEYEVYKKEMKMKKRIEKERREMEKKMEREMRHSHHHHSHHNSTPPQPMPQPMPQPIMQPPVPQSKDMTGEEAYLMRARLSQNPVQTTPMMMQSNIPASRVVLLTNLVGAGEVDDTLQEETAEECEKYGVVERCLIYEVKGNVPDDEAVRIFIKFSRLEEANKAYNALNGRFFGGRKVKAKYFDEDRFTRLDLAPRPGDF
ncbi:hypothetical protein H8356DRAFT_1075745 [Neocallimastix lanati (nom. inval.)]|jgi:hypothetical protein|uniref:RRM domain-containing protein n=1 Tax=Neocallimastix californiae TaxID=1754190 RepID=A0A1Y2ETJ4_9FUNG|nr:hypothetical protein H8356DRAFT_1075745 [Neocallimastix sp. JGI-2020a]ORY74883.1 hypothetical protein LY90DRAFT_699116 [Neocallimastix californiae]|eukprot:ORY74883.1 hypothetical protein LY90DRAFT_699116 [Neocallimastix californiae]